MISIESRTIYVISPTLRHDLCLWSELKLARSLVGKIFSLKFNPLISSQIRPAVLIASGSDKVA